MKTSGEMLAEDPDYILVKRFNYSLVKLLERYPDGAPPNVVAAALGMTEDEVEKRYQAIVKSLRGAVRA
jgi:hypothetical protein